MSPEPRLKTGFRVSAYLARLAGAGLYAAVIRRGDPDAGAVEVKASRPDRTATLYARHYDMEGRGLWAAVGREGAPESDVDALLARRLSRDPDLWAIEVETRDGRALLDEDAP